MRLSQRLKFRMCAVLLGVLPFLLIEISLRIFGAAEPPLVASFDQEFHIRRPLFVQNPTEQQFEIAENRRLYFAQESFPSDRSPNTRRVFVVGGSTVQGRPFSIATSFPTFLKTNLRCACPSVDWQVINCGGISYGTHRLRPIISEITEYAPDLIIICTGHNEFLEHVSYQFTDATMSRQWAHGLAAHSRTVRWVRAFFQKGVQLPEEVDTTLDHLDGLKLYRRENLKRESVLANFTANLQTMLSECESKNINTMLIAPPVNLRDCPPFKSEFTDAASQKAVENLIKNLPTSPDSSAAWKNICREDPEYALGWYQLGQAEFNQRRFHKAIKAFTQAIDKDICPLRMTSEQRAAMKEVAEGAGIPLVDLQQVVAARSRHGIVGHDLLVDHVHPSFRTNFEIATQLTPTVLSLLDLAIEDGNWAATADIKFDQHLQSLEDNYFLSGQRTLNTLQDWSRGRGDGPALRGE